MKKIKKCTKCGKRKSLSAYSINTATPDGYQNRCEACRKQKDIIIEEEEFKLILDMNYEQLIETVSTIVANEKINKTGLTLVYTLNEKNHKQMNEQLFFKSNPATAVFEPSDEFELEIGGIVIRFVKEPVEVPNEEF